MQKETALFLEGSGWECTVLRLALVLLSVAGVVIVVDDATSVSVRAVGMAAAQTPTARCAAPVRPSPAPTVKV